MRPTTAGWACEYCGSPGSTLYEVDINGATSQMIRCEGCRSCQIEELIPEEVLLAFYEDDYFGVEVNLEKRLGDRLAKDYLRKLKRYLPKLAEHPGKILEVGAGYGYFAGRVNGWLGRPIDVVEPNRTCREHIASIPSVHLAGRTWADIEPVDPYAIVFAFHLIEHLARGAPFLAEMKKLTAPGSLLVLITPNALAGKLERWGERWLWAQPNQHLQFLSPLIPEEYFIDQGYEVLQRQEMVAGSIAYPSSVLMRIQDTKQHLWRRIEPGGLGAFLPLVLTRSLTVIRPYFQPLHRKLNLLTLERQFDRILGNEPKDEFLWVLRRT